MENEAINYGIDNEELMNLGTYGRRMFDMMRTLRMVDIHDIFEKPIRYPVLEEKLNHIMEDG